MAQIYDPNQAGAFNKALQSGLSTADAALQAGITATQDFALGTNGNLGGLIPGANAVLGPGNTFQSVDFAQTFSGQPAQGTQLAMNAAQVQQFRATPGNENIPFVQNPEGPPGDLIPYIVVTGTEPPPTTTAGNGGSGPAGAGGPVPSIEIPPRPVAGLDLTATSPFAPFDQVQAVPRPTLAAEAAPSPTAFSATDPRVTVYGPPPVVSTVQDNVPRVEVNGVGQVPVTDSPFVQAPGELGRGTAAPDPQPTIYNVQAPGELGRGTTAPDPQPIIYNIQAPGELGRGTAAPEPVAESAAETARLQRQDNAATIETDAESNRLARQEAAAKDNTIQQAAIQSTYKQPGNGDWRFRISLAENSTYLYSIINNAESAGPGILAPLAGTGGVIFPYTPQVTSTYQARYNTYELVHSNYRGAFYQSSFVGDIQIRAVFTAQDTTEAKYMLAVIHFFRSVTKMFYGQDKQRGAPPPLVFLSGLGDYQYNRHPAVVTQFDYTLPSDVDYIRADNPNNFGTDLLNRRTPTQAAPTNPLGAAINRLGLSGLFPGATPTKPAPVPITNSVTNTAKATYVPTKIDISLTLMPMQTRDQVSKEFSLEKFANGNLLRGGFW